MQIWLKIIIVGIAGFFLFPVMPVMAQDADDSGRGSRRSSRSSRSSRSGDDGNRGSTTDDRERRREDRSKSRESNSRSSSRSGRSSRESDDKDAKEKDTKTVEGSKKTKSGSKSSSGGGRPTIDIAFEMQVDPETNIMYMEGISEHPSLNVNVVENQKFVTRLALYNAKSSPFVQMDTSLKYDPALIEPIGVDDSTISSSLAKPARVLVDKKRGLLSISADFKEPRSDSFITLAKIQWRALEPVAGTPIQFVNTENHPSGIFNAAGDNILHYRSDGTVESSRNAGLLDATVTIEPTDNTREVAISSVSPFSAVALATNISMGTAEGGMQLFLRARDQSVEVGENFIVDILYRNPKRADMDTVKLQVRFDPQQLQVVDSDEGNWITRGVNIFDGAYHEDLPFDFHRKNVAYNSTGLINYEMGFSSQVPVPAEGVIASIQFTAIAPVSSTPIIFDAEQDGANESDTAITFLGFNLLGKPGERQHAISNTSVRITAN